MRIFICALLFIFITFPNSAQSMNNVGSSRYQHTAQNRLRLGQILYLSGHPEGCIFKLVFQGEKWLLPEREAKQIWMHWEQLPFSRGERDLKNGDLLVRQRKPIAKVQGLSFHGIGLEYAGLQAVEDYLTYIGFKLINIHHFGRSNDHSVIKLSIKNFASDNKGQENLQPLKDDIVFRLGDPIAKYDENNVRRRIDFINYANNDYWLGQIQEDEF